MALMYLAEFIYLEETVSIKDAFEKSANILSTQYFI